MLDKISRKLKALNTSASEKHYISILSLLIGITSIVTMWIILTHDLRAWVDIGLGDEAKYLGGGINFFNSKPDPYWGPIYSFWYFILHIFQSNPIKLYYLNYSLMTLLPCIALYVFQLKMKVAPVFSFYLSFAFLISQINLPTWPKVSHFTLVFIFVGLILVQQFKERDAKFTGALVLSLLITYIRPEFILSSLLFLIVIIRMIIKNHFRLKYLATIVAITAIFTLTIGIPYSSDRNLTAFGQAYEKYLDFNKRVNSNDVPLDWQQILARDFDNPKSVSDAFLNNNENFLKHIEVNIKRLPIDFQNITDTLLPAYILPVSYLLKISLILIILGTLFILFLLGKLQKYRELVFNGFAERKDLLFCSVILSIPPLLSVLLYYPRSHYLLLLLPVIYLAVSQLIMPLKFRSAFIDTSFLSVTVFLCFYFIPRLSSYFPKPDLKRIKAVKYIEKLNITDNINLLENEGGLTAYLPGNYKWIKTEVKKENFDKFIIKNNVGIIYFSGQLNNATTFRNDSTWYRFLVNPGSFGFKVIDENNGARIFLRK